MPVAVKVAIPTTSPTASVDQRLSVVGSHSSVVTPQFTRIGNRINFLEYNTLR